MGKILFALIRMKQNHKRFLKICGSIVCCVALSVAATPKNKLYLALSTAPNATHTERLIKISSLFINSTQMNDPLGEGKKGIFNRKPLARLDAFSCQTFVETMIALALSVTPAQFYSHLARLRYRHGKISFITRNHFPSLDWIPNNTQNGTIKNITEEVAQKKEVKQIDMFVNKARWYHKLNKNRLYRPDLSPPEQNILAKRLHTYAKQEQRYFTETHYIPLTALFKKASPNLTIFNRIPSGSIIMMVRKNWPTQQGTHQPVSHMGLVIRKNHTLFIRAATTRGKYGVRDIPLIGYLKSYQESPTVIGIELFKLKNSAF